MVRPASKTRTLSPFSVSSLAAQPPVIPEPTMIASYVFAGMSSPLGLLLSQRRATVICTRHDFEAELFGESDFRRVVAVDGDAFEDVPERALELVVALGGDGVAVAHRAWALMLGHRSIVDGAEQSRLLLGGGIDEIFAEEVFAL